MCVDAANGSGNIPFPLVLGVHPAIIKILDRVDAPHRHITTCLPHSYVFEEDPEDRTVERD